GGAALTHLLGGEGEGYFCTTVSSIEDVRGGGRRALAGTAAARPDARPSIPAMAQVVPGSEPTSLGGGGAAKNTPTEIVDKLNKEINAGLADPNMKARLVDLGGTVLAGSPADFGQLISEETEKWGKVVKFSGAKAD